MPNLDSQKVDALSEQVFGHMNSTMITALTIIGDQLGLYRGLQGTGPITSEELATKLGFSERWVREWLHGQAAIGYVDYLGDGQFHLTDEAAAVFADESTPAFAIGGLGIIPALIGHSLPKMRKVFETGIGLTYDEFGPDFAHSQERFWAPWFKHMLVGTVLPSLDGIVEKLKRGAKVADIGCGAGVAIVEMAKAFPRSEFYGYDNSENALARALALKKETGVSNASFVNPDVAPLPEVADFDLITTFDCIHDLAHPTPVIHAIRKSLKPDGTWFVVDIHAGDSLEENLEEANPMLPMLYGFSVLCCLSSSMSTPDGEGFGTVGFGEAKARRMSAEAGFTRFKCHDFDNPLNAYYEVQP